MFAAAKLFHDFEDELFPSASRAKSSLKKELTYPSGTPPLLSSSPKTKKQSLHREPSIDIADPSACKVTWDSLYQLTLKSKRKNKYIENMKRFQ